MKKTIFAYSLGLVSFFYTSHAFSATKHICSDKNGTVVFNDNEVKVTLSDGKTNINTIQRKNDPLGVRLTGQSLYRSKDKKESVVDYQDKPEVLYSYMDGDVRKRITVGNCQK